MMKKKRSKGSSSSSLSTRKPKLSSTSSSSKPKNPHPDLISALPDSLLLHILSLLNTHQVIRTSLLSRRWRYLWRSIPCLTLWGTANYIDKCLFHHNDSSKLQKLHISFDYEEEDKQHALLVDSWLNVAIKCKVEDFKLEFYDSDDFDNEYDKLYKLPHSFYLLCITLTSLTLHACNLNLPDSFRLDSLKKLSLGMIELNPDSIEHFSSSCPSLEDIHVEDCNRESDLDIVIINEHVKRLEISFHGKYGSSTNVKINAPTLLSLGIYDCFPTVYFHVENLASLMILDVIGEDNLITCCEYVYFEPGRRINCFEELLYDLRHVKHLKLCNQCVQVLSLMKLMSSNILSISATCLELKASLKKWEFPGIRYLLENCSNLEKLKIVVDDTYCDEIAVSELPDEFIETHDFEEGEYWASFETEVPSIMQNIKTIEIELSYKSCHEEIVRFLLKNAKILESMVINSPKGYSKYNYERLFKLSQRLHTFPRSSPNAKLFIT